MGKKKSLLLLAMVFITLFMAGILGFAYVDAQLTDGCPDVARVFQWATWQQVLFNKLYWPMAITVSLVVAFGLSRRLDRIISLRMC